MPYLNKIRMEEFITFKYTLRIYLRVRNVKAKHYTVYTRTKICMYAKIGVSGAASDRKTLCE